MATGLTTVVVWPTNYHICHIIKKVYVIFISKFKVSLGVLTFNENKNEDMIQILKFLLNNYGQNTKGEGNKKIIFSGGDQVDVYEMQKMI